MAIDNVPLNPQLTFTHISVHVIHMLARMMAREAVRAQLRNEGVNPQHVPPREINERATTYLHDHPEVWRDATTRAHRIDEKEGQRKERQKLRGQELARLRKSRSVLYGVRRLSKYFRRTSGHSGSFSHPSKTSFRSISLI
jgi:hypothetical protein